MAINLWKLQKPTSYNPLPTGLNNTISVNRGLYIASFKAKSPTNSPLAVTGNNLVLTSEFQSFKVEVNAVDVVRFYDTNVKGDIIITDIQLVQKPLPKLTINGISDNVADWEQGNIFSTGGLSASTTLLRTKNLNPVPSGQVITISCAEGYSIGLNEYDGAGVPTATRGTNKTITLTVNTKNVRLIVYRNDNAVITPSEITQIKPMLNLGATPAPYSKKTGDKMVAPTIKGKNQVPTDANLWKQGTQSGTYADEIWLPILVKVKPNTPYQLRVKAGYYVGCDEIAPLETNPYTGTTVKWNAYAQSHSLTTQAGTGNLRLFIRKEGNATLSPSDLDKIQIQLEEGLVAGVYEPYGVQVNKKPKKVVANAKTGLSFNGNDYIQVDGIGSLLANSDDISLSIDFVPSNNPSTHEGIIGLRDETNFLNFYILQLAGTNNLECRIRTSSGNMLTLSPYITPFVRNKVEISLKNGLFKVFVNDVEKGSIACSYTLPTNNVPLYIGASRNVSSFFTKKGIIFNTFVKRQGSIVAQYDFENPSNIVGDKVLLNAKNLIPSFDDARWSLHANADVLGKDVLRLEANGFNQDSFLLLNIPNGNYRFMMNSNGFIRGYQHPTELSTPILTGTDQVITVTNGIFRLRLGGASSTGTFDFIKPQLYELTSREGTIVGNPTKLRKASKRNLEAKR